MRRTVSQTIFRTLLLRYLRGKGKTALSSLPCITKYIRLMLTLCFLMTRIGDLVNDFRKKVLGLSSLNLRSGPSIADRMKVPWTYCMGPLVKKPKDWKNHIG